MPSSEVLIAFTAAALLMNISPCPSNLYVMARAIAQGTKGCQSVFNIDPLAASKVDPQNQISFFKNLLTDHPEGVLKIKDTFLPGTKGQRSTLKRGQISTLINNIPGAALICKRHSETGRVLLR
jgi:hypothetical protein